MPTSRPFYLSSDIVFTICGTVGKDEDGSSCCSQTHLYGLSACFVTKMFLHSMVHLSDLLWCKYMSKSPTILLRLGLAHTQVSDFLLCVSLYMTERPTPTLGNMFTIKVYE